MLQHIEINNFSEKNLTVIKSNFKIDGIYLFLKGFYALLIEKIFENNSIEIVTVNPQNDALCFELGNSKKIKIGKDIVLVTSIDNPAPDLFLQIAGSTEFELGMLSISCIDIFPQEERVSAIYKYLNTDIEMSEENVPYKFCYCESDGYIIYLVNTSITQQQINEIAIKAMAFNNK